MCKPNLFQRKRNAAVYEIEGAANGDLGLIVLYRDDNRLHEYWKAECFVNGGSITVIGSWERADCLNRAKLAILQNFNDKCAECGGSRVVNYDGEDLPCRTCF